MHEVGEEPAANQPFTEELTMADYSDRILRENERKAAEFDRIVRMFEAHGYSRSADTLEGWLAERMGIPTGMATPEDPTDTPVLWYDVTLGCTVCEETWEKRLRYIEGAQPHPGELEANEAVGACPNGHKLLPTVIGATLAAGQEGATDGDAAAGAGSDRDDASDAGARIPESESAAPAPDAGGADVRGSADATPSAEAGEPGAGAASEGGIPGGDDPGSAPVGETP